MASRNRKARKLAAVKKCIRPIIWAANLVGCTIEDLARKAAKVLRVPRRPKTELELERLRRAYVGAEGSHSYKAPEWLLSFAKAVCSAVCPRTYFNTVSPELAGS